MQIMYTRTPDEANTAARARARANKRRLRCKSHATRCLPARVEMTQRGGALRILMEWLAYGVTARILSTAAPVPAVPVFTSITVGREWRSALQKTAHQV